MKTKHTLLILGKNDSTLKILLSIMCFFEAPIMYK